MATRVSILVLLVALSFPLHARYWSSERTEPLEAAHADFLDGKWEKMVGHALDALTAAPNRREVFENVQALFDAAYARTGGELPAGWSLPAQLELIKLTVDRLDVRVEKDGRSREQHAIHLIVRPRKGAVVKQVQLLRFPDEVVLDKRAGIGEWVEAKAGEEPWSHLERGFQSPPAAGLYILNLELGGASPVRGWCLLGGPSTGDFPKVLNPGKDGRVKGGLPELEWSDYRSPQYQRFESRKVLVSVTKPRQFFDSALWSKLLDAPATKARYDEAKGLSPGTYWLHLSYMESRKFGGLVLTRATGTTIPFEAGR